MTRGKIKRYFGYVDGIVGMLFFIAIGFFFFKYVIADPIINNTDNGYGSGIDIDYDDIFTGSVNTGDNTGTGNNGTGEVTPKTEMEKFVALETFATFNFPIQPEYSYGDYESNTQLLTNYAQANLKTVSIPTIQDGYLYIRLRRPLPKGRSAVIYINTPGYRCGGGIKQMGFSNNANEYLYKLENINLVGTACDANWIPLISGKTITIGGYVGTFDGNGIEEMRIAWKE